MNPSNLPKFDLVVLGGGPAGASGAAAGGLLGKKVALVEKAALVGGAGINTGTIPSKTCETSLMLRAGARAGSLSGLSLRREATVADFMRHEKQVTK
jgi:NAD(P) transhydrogenase